MKTKCLSALLVTSISLAIAMAPRVHAGYSENFDSDVTAFWKTNNNGAGTNAANYFYDYSTVGIPSAPHSTGSSTRGLKLQANISGTGPASGNLPGISVSPLGQNFNGDYSLRFDWWHNFIGGTTSGIGNSAGGSGSTQLSTFGIMSSGTAANFAGSADSLFYAATGDGASSADFRAYAPEAVSGYTATVTGVNAHNTYAAGSTNSSASLYMTLFPAGATAPTVQQTTFPGTQTGSTLAGMSGFRWHDVLITKAGAIVTWKVDGTLLATTDTSLFTVATAGTNILFGMADTSLGAGTPAATFQAVDFTLIDNVVVTTVPEASPVLFGLAACGMVGFIAWWRKGSNG